MECLYYFLGFLLLAARLPLDAAKRFHDVLGNERPSAYMREHNQLNGWSSDENDWNEKLYPVWKRGDMRWKNSWKGGRVQAVLTSDSPALVGSNITFVVNLVFPRCQKEDANGNIVYEKNCRNEAGLSADPYVYNWTAWSEDSDGENGTGQSHHNVFPDGKPFPHHPGWRRWNFVYVFHTLGPAGDNPLELSEIPDENCQINRYGHFQATVTIVEGILEVNIIQTTDVLMLLPGPDSSLIDFVVTCQGSIPTEVCTIISDPTCEITQNAVCSPVDVDEMCLLTVRRAFNGSGTYCVNLTLGDDTSLALTSTLISVPDRDPVSKKSFSTCMTKSYLKLSHTFKFLLNCNLHLFAVRDMLIWPKDNI
uniref:Glycoprotein nmb n=1 Tax=Papio anubis TaxID=9555 RepID=A0A2I3M842_PAPAN